MSPAATATAGLQDDLGFRPATPVTAATSSSPDDDLGFRPAQPTRSARIVSGGDDLEFRPATPTSVPKTPPIKQFDYSAESLPSRTALPQPNPMYPRLHAVPGIFGEPELTEESQRRVASEEITPPGSRIRAGETGPAAKLDELADYIRHGGGPASRAAGHTYEGTQVGVSPGVADVMGGPVEGPVRMLAGGARALGPYAGEPADLHSEVRGLNEAARGAFQTVTLPLAATQPEFIPTMAPYAAGGSLAETGLRKLGVPAEEAELASNVALIGGGMLHGAGEVRPEYEGATFDRARAATEPIIAGETAPDYLAQLRQRIGDRIAATERQERINAPVDIPRTPETTAAPPILARPSRRSPMEELSAQAKEARAPQEFRQQLTQEISDQIINRLRDEGLFEQPRPSVVDRRAVRPEDVEPYQRPRTFVVTPGGTTSVVPRGRALEDMLAAERPGRAPARSPEEVELAFRPAETQRALPPASAEDQARIEQEQQRYDAALERARAYGQPQPRPTVEAAKPQDITADSRRMANLAISRFSNPVEQQYARETWSSMIGQGRTPVPPSGVTRVRADEIRNSLADISRGDITGRVPDPKTVYAPDVIEEARAMMEHTHGFLSQQERPGRYFADMGDETSLTGQGPKLPVTAVTSLRGQFPWFANLKESPGDLAKALGRGEGPSYDRLITAAADHITRTRAETQRMARSVEPNIENLAGQVRAIDPALADFLSDAASGNLSTWTETHQQRLANIEGRIADAKAALEFGRAIDDLASEERAGNESASTAGKAQASAARGEESARAGETAAPPGREVTPERFASRSREELSAATSTAADQSQALRTDNLRLEEQLRNRPEAPAEERRDAQEHIEQNRQMIEALERSKGEAGFATLDLVRDVLSGRLPKEAWQRFVAEPFIEKGLRIGDKYRAVREADPDVAGGLHLLDNAPAYFRAKASQRIQSTIGNLSRDQERLFTLMADADSRENLRANHPAEFRQATNDPAIQEALRKYRPIEQQLTAARQRMGGATLDRDYLRRVYDQHVSGIGQPEARGTSERATTAFDRVIQPQRLGNMSREATAEYHYRHGLHEFGPAFGTKFLATNLRGLEDQVARGFIAKATELKPGAPEPRSITYRGEKYYRPDIARDVRQAGQKNVKEYDRYDPAAGVKYPQKGASKYLGPRDVVRALNDYNAGQGEGPGAVRRFLQEQVIGFGFGIPHVANILRRVTQSAPLGAANPEAWARAWKVAFGKELRGRGISGMDDPTFDRLMQHGAITTGEMANLKRYWGGNLNPANWARSLAGIGHKLIFEPGSFGGLGGVDQRARIYIADLVKSQNPGLADEQIARAVNTQLGDYNRANWTDRQKIVAKFMLFPGWDTSSMRWVIQHPIRTTVPPALLIWTANQILSRYGQNRPEDASDIENIHWGDRSIGVTLLRESMARNLMRPAFNYAQSRIRGESGQRAAGEAARGITQGAGGLVGMLRPDITAVIDLAMNRQSPFGGQELVSQNDHNLPGRILPNRALEKQAALVIRHAIPALDRMLDSDQGIDFRAFAGSNVGLPNYKSGAEQRLKRNTAEGMDVSQTVSRLAKSDRGAARRFIQDPDNAAYALFRNDLDSMSKTLQRLDDARATIGTAKNLSADEKRERLGQIDRARQNLLRNADGLDRLLFERKQQNRERAARPAGTAAADHRFVGTAEPELFSAP